MDRRVDIKSDDFWVKVVGMLQQNWALVEPTPDGDVHVFFINDTSGIFDELTLSSEEQAIKALGGNGFSCYADEEEMQSFLCPPSSPYHRQAHPNGPIYSLGPHWRDRD